jgi:hypothetical protein
MLHEQPGQVTRRGVCDIGHAGHRPVGLGPLADGILHAMQRRMEVVAIGEER